MIRSTLLLALMSMSASLFAAELKFESGPTRTHLLELFTSEGCSSCPPAEAWLTKLKDEPRLWRDFVPMAFHVDYWDRLGWRDPFAAKEWTARQYAYSAHWQSTSVYTPGFVLDGREWRNSTLPAPSNDKPGGLTITVTEGDRLTAKFTPADEKRKLELHVARLGFDLRTDVKAGENRGRKLQHDFVVLALAHAPLASNEAQLNLPPVNSKQIQLRKEAIAVWITEAGQVDPIQAVGGWLQ